MELHERLILVIEEEILVASLSVTNAFPTGEGTQAGSVQDSTTDQRWPNCTSYVSKVLGMPTGPPLNQHWSTCLVLAAVLPCKAKMQYLRTLQVRRYCILSLQSILESGLLAAWSYRRN